jgi:hypothetical protein
MYAEKSSRASNYQRKEKEEKEMSQSNRNSSD